MAAGGDFGFMRLQQQGPIRSLWELEPWTCGRWEPQRTLSRRRTHRSLYEAGPHLRLQFPFLAPQVLQNLPRVPFFTQASVTGRGLLTPSPRGTPREEGVVVREPARPQEPSLCKICFSKKIRHGCLLFQSLPTLK